jgi:hypothetical protein
MAGILRAADRQRKKQALEMRCPGRMPGEEKSAGASTNWPKSYFQKQKVSDTMSSAHSVKSPSPFGRMSLISKEVGADVVGIGGDHMVELCCQCID